MMKALALAIKLFSSKTRLHCLVLAVFLTVGGLGLVWVFRHRSTPLPAWEQIEAAIAAEQWGQARSDLAAWLERSPDNPRALFRLAYVQDRLGDLEGCLGSLRRIPDEAPQKLEALFRTAWVLQKALYGAQSERAFQEYLARAAAQRGQEARRFDATEALVTLYKLEARYREARQILWEFYDAVSDPALKLRALSMTTRLEFQRLVPEVVIPTLEKFLEADAQDYQAYRGLGAMLILLGDGARGCAILQRCVNEHSDDLDAWDLWLDGLLKCGEIAAAQRAVQKLPAEADSRASFWMHRGTLWAAQGDLTRAIAAYERSLQMEPYQREWQYQMSRVLRDAGQHERANEHAQRARDRLERYAEFQNAFGKLSDTYEVRDPAEMRKLADWSEYLGMYREALGWYEQVLVAQPQDEAAHVAMKRLRKVVREQSELKLADTSKQRLRAAAPAGTAPGSNSTADTSLPEFAQVARESGIEFEYFRGAQGRYLPIEANGGGIGMFDYDEDGLLDLYFVNGNLAGTDPPERTYRSRLYRNRGDGKFDDVAEISGTAQVGYGFGCGAADYDNDGFVDLYVTCYGANTLYRNNGDGTFSNVSATSGTDCTRFSSSCAFADLDRDGDLDLYLATYVEFDPVRFKPCVNNGRKDYCPPYHFEAQHDVLFRNDGDGSFSDVSEAANILQPNGKGLGVVVANLDDDGWPEVFVANDGESNFLFHNLTESAPAHEIRLQDVALEQGAAVNGMGQAQACMGIACGDYDADQRLDLLVTNFFMEGCTLYRNRGTQGFVDSTAAARLLVPTTHTMGWGTQFIDYDNDGWLDVFVTNGHVNEAVPVWAMTPQLFRNGRGRFEEVTGQAGSYFADRWVGRGAAFGDYDNDGRVDIVVSHLQRPVALLRNQTISDNHFVRLELAGRQSNRSAVNARVLVATSEGGPQGSPLVREVVGGGSYLSSSDRRLLVGVGRAERVAIEVRWPSGDVDRWADLPVDEWWYLVQGLPPRLRRSLSAR